MLSAAWFEPFTFLIFIAWVPLLILEGRLSVSVEKRKSLKLIGLSYLSFFIWNLLVTWWIVYASFGGACMAIICNSLLMCVVFMIYHKAKNRIPLIGAWLLIPLWLAWEYGHTLWDLTWTWLTLGNVFAYRPDWVQWYEYTGTGGGSLWVLIVNILIYQLTLKEKKLNYYSGIVAVLVIPFLISVFILRHYKNKAQSEKSCNVLVVQPNIDPYNEKFDVGTEVQLNNLLNQIRGSLNQKTDYLILPETFLTEYIRENDIENWFSIRYLRDSLLTKFPQLTIISGASTYRIYQEGETVSATARQTGDREALYDSYNTAIQLDNFSPAGIYHKSKLVPGVERMPFPALFKPLEKLAIDMGGTTGSLGTQETRTVFFNKNKIGMAPVICYESVYGDYLRDYIKNGAHVICIITNDGWWDNTPGHKQHLNYARLRAIETRKQIARSANTGISCFIDELGNIEQATRWWEPALIQKNMNVNSGETFFVKYGDLVSYISWPLAILVFLFSQYLRFFRKSFF